MTRQQLLLTFFIIFVTMFIVVLLDNATVTWNCNFRCLHLHGKIAYGIASLCVLGVILVGLIKRKR